MTIKKELQNGDTVWFTIDEKRLDIDENTGKFFCYIKHTEPNSITFGESLKDKKGNSLEFSSIEEAKKYIDQIN